MVNRVLSCRSFGFLQHKPDMKKKKKKVWGALLYWPDVSLAHGRVYSFQVTNMRPTWYTGSWLLTQRATISFEF